MKEKTLSIFEAQTEILNLPKQLVTGKLHVVAVTCDGKPTLAILPYGAYKKLLETIDSLQDTIAMCQDEEWNASFPFFKKFAFLEKILSTSGTLLENFLSDFPSSRDTFSLRW